MKKYKNILIAVNLVVLLAFFINAVVKKESTLSKGKLILLELAPVDPRSLMQGDYMQLRYKLTSELHYSFTCHKGICTVMVNDSAVATQMLLPPDKDTTGNGQPYKLKYGCNGDDLHLGAESYFFEEGQAEKFAKAKYGGLRVDDAGNSILVGLYDENQKLIQ